MASIYLRRLTWWVKFSHPMDGRIIRESLDTSDPARVMRRFGFSGLKFGASKQSARRWTDSDVVTVERLSSLRSQPAAKTVNFARPWRKRRNGAAPGAGTPRR